MLGGLWCGAPLPLGKTLSQITAIDFQRIADVNERKRPVSIVVKNPFFGVLKKTARVRTGQRQIFLETFYGVQENREHQFLFGLKIARSLPLLAVLLAGQHIEIGRPMKWVVGYTTTRQRLTLHRSIRLFQFLHEFSAGSSSAENFFKCRQSARKDRHARCGSPSGTRSRRRILHSG